MPAVRRTGKLRLVVHGQPDFPGFKQADKDADEKIEVLGSRITGRGGEAEASLAEEHVQRPFLFHDLGGQRPVEDRDQHAQQQSCDFHDHPSLDSIGGKKPLQSVEQPNHALLQAGPLFMRVRIELVVPS